MQEIDLKCPNCLVCVVPYGDGAYGKCEYCGSVFRLDDGAAIAAKDAEREEPPARRKAPYEGDLRKFFQDFYESLDAEDRMELGKDLYFDGFLQAHKKKEAQTRQYFSVGEDSTQSIYLVLDTTMFGSGKKGLAVTDNGIFYHDDGDHDGKIGRERFAKLKFRRTSGRVEFDDGDPYFITDEDSARILVKCLKRLQG